MENRIPIDELFHDKLFQGKEQMNLGAWANMERMLDGKNPYAEQEKKRRGLVPFWLMLLVATGIVGAGYLIKTGNKSTPIAKSATKSAVANDAQSLISASTPIIPSEVSSQQPPVSKNESDHNRSAGEPRTNPAQHENNTTASVSSTNFETKSDNQRMHPENSLDRPDSKRANTTDEDHIKQPASALSNLATVKSSRRNRKTTQMTVSNAVPLGVNTAKSFKGDNVQSEAAMEAPTDMSASSGDNVTTTSFSKVEKIPVVTINQKTIRNRDGSAQKVIGDTVDKSVIEKVTEQMSEAKGSASLNPMVLNPRFKKLTEEEERNARLQRTEAPKADKDVVLASAESMPASKVSSEISIASSQKAKAAKQTGYFEDLRKFAVDTYRKISNFIMFSPKPDTYTGLSMGVNASLSNSKRNFGGFQGGFTSLTPINDYVSFLAEFKFFYRKNGGYTPNDISYKIKNTSQDTVSLAHVQQTIYQYQKDSTVKTYNFKNFYSIELPLMMQLNYRSFALYGGANLAYNFRLKTTEKSRNYVVDGKETLPNSAPYAFPIDKPSQYQRSDFSGRFGLGYTVGASYSFSPQLYLDLRVTQNVWDNMKTLTAREISNGFFKVPSVQFSLGYRFRKFTPDN